MHPRMPPDLDWVRVVLDGLRLLLEVCKLLRR
jgi:hypothetical protein